MAGLFLTTLVFLVVIASGSDAVLLTSPSELYWKTVLPRTLIPITIQDLMKTSVEKTFSLKSRNISPLALQGYEQNKYTRMGLSSELDPNDPNKSDFLLERDLRPGTTMILHLQRSINHTGFLPRAEADSIPFSAADLPSILSRFGVKPGSPESTLIEETLQDCEAEALHGESKHCATSVESMLDFAASTIGITTTHLLAMSPAPAAASPLPAANQLKKQQYTIAWPGARRVTEASSRSVTCHPLTYPYAVYYCHLLRHTRVYEVPLVGKDGSRVTAVVPCHADTASWNPMHVSFQVLKVKPGTLPICHFVPEDNVIFAPADYTSGALINSS